MPGLQHPVVLVRVEEELSRNATQACSIEGTLALAAEDAVVLVTVDAEDGRVPTIYIEVGTFGKGIVLAGFLDEL